MNKRKPIRSNTLAGWLFILPALLLIVSLSFLPMFQAIHLSFQTGMGNNLDFGGLINFRRIFQDRVFHQAIRNTFFYLILQVPIMLVTALILASMLNNKRLRFKGVFRTAIFLPCATSLVAYAIIFRSLFAFDGFVNQMLINTGILNEGINWLANPSTARFVLVLSLIWRWTGYNMIFYLAGLQNIEYSIYEAAMIDGASVIQRFRHITIPLLKPIIVLTLIMCTNGNLQLFDESVNLTSGGPGNATITMSHYVYNTVFTGVPNFGYAASMSVTILLMIAALAFIQLKVGDKRD